MKQSVRLQDIPETSFDDEPEKYKVATVIDDSENAFKEIELRQEEMKENLVNEPILVADNKPVPEKG